MVGWHYSISTQLLIQSCKLQPLSPNGSTEFGVILQNTRLLQDIDCYYGKESTSMLCVFKNNMFAETISITALHFCYKQALEDTNAALEDK